MKYTFQYSNGVIQTKELIPISTWELIHELKNLYDNKKKIKRIKWDRWPEDIVEIVQKGFERHLYFCHDSPLHNSIKGLKPGETGIMYLPPQQGSEHKIKYLSKSK